MHIKFALQRMFLPYLSVCFNAPTLQLRTKNVTACQIIEPIKMAVDRFHISLHSSQFCYKYQSIIVQY